VKLRLRTVGVALPGLDGCERGREIDAADGATPTELLARLQPPDPAHLALFVNGAQLHGEALAATRLADGDELVLVRPIEGG
jgi:sulfur carrier protein ThiS